MSNFFPLKEEINQFVHEGVYKLGHALSLPKMMLLLCSPFCFDFSYLSKLATGEPLSAFCPAANKCRIAAREYVTSKMVNLWQFKLTED